MIYDGADKAIRQMNRANLKAFNLLKLAKWDEISVIRAVGKTYDDSTALAKQKYLEIASEAYVVALYKAKIAPERATRMGRDAIDRDWVLDMLEEADPVTLYIFMDEMERKKQRLIEALSVAHDRNREIDKALRYWTAQVGQYADNSVYWARLQAFRDAGFERVRWVTMEDNRVCRDCDDLDGRIFRIDEVPPPQHFNCRCYLVPVLD